MSDPVVGKIVWDKTGERFYETGTSNGVLYPKNASGAYGTGVPWNGLTAVNENPSGAEETKLFADNIKYLSLYSAEEFGCTIEAFTYPKEFEACDGSIEIAPGVMAGQQNRRGFGFSYRTILGNDEQGEAYGYKLHIVYGATASPSQKSYGTVNDSPNAVTLSWDVTTTPVAINADLKPTALLVIDSTKIDSEKLAAIEDILYGTDPTTAEEGGTATPGTAPRLPMPSEIIELLEG